MCTLQRQNTSLGEIKSATDASLKATPATIGSTLRARVCMCILQKTESNYAPKGLRFWTQWTREFVYGSDINFDVFYMCIIMCGDKRCGTWYVNCSAIKNIASRIFKILDGNLNVIPDGFAAPPKFTGCSLQIGYVASDVRGIKWGFINRQPTFCCSLIVDSCDGIILIHKLSERERGKFVMWNMELAWNIIYAYNVV